MVKDLGRGYGVFRVIGFEMFHTEKKENEMWFYSTGEALEHDLRELSLTRKDLDIKTGYAVFDARHTVLDCFIFVNKGVSKTWFETIADATSWFEDLKKRKLIEEYEELHKK